MGVIINLLLTLVALTCCLHCRVNAALFGVHQTGTYWGALIDASGSTSNVKFDLYPSFSQATGAVSYDPVTGQSLFELYKPHAIAFGPMCKNSNGFQPQVLFNMSDIMVNQPDIGDAIAGKISAFAMYDSQIYFLHYGTYFTDEGHVIHIFQIRKFITCSACGKDPYRAVASNSPFSLSFTVNCSVLVTEAVRFSSEEDDDVLNLEFEGSKSLKVAKQAGSEELSFYFQIGKMELSDTGPGSLEMILYKASSTSQTQEIHREPVNPKFFEWNMYAIGSVDYKNGLLCWTTGEKVMCRENEGEAMEVVGATDVISHGVCVGNDVTHLMDISGVSIVQNHGNKQVIAFGCNPSSKKITGAGLVVIDSDQSKTIQPLMAGEEALSAGSVVSVQALQQVCSYEPRPDVCVRLERTTLPPPTTSQEVQPEAEVTKKPEGGEPEVEPETGNEVNGEAVSGTDDGSGSGHMEHCWWLILNTLLLTAIASTLS